MSRADRFRRTLSGANEVPDTNPSRRVLGFAQYYNSIRSLMESSEKPITMAVIKDWQEHTYVLLERWERDVIFAMDRAFRRAYADVLRFHSERTQSKTGPDKDYKKANG